MIMLPLRQSVAQETPQPETVASETRRSDSVAMQGLLARRISLRLDRVGLDQALQAAATAGKVQMLFNEQYLDHNAKSVTLRLSDVSLGAAFDQILSGTNLYVVPSTPTTLVLREGAPRPALNLAQAQATGSVAGSVTNAETGKPIGGVTVMLTGTKRATTTNESGVFVFAKVPTGTHALMARLLGYNAQSITVTVDSGKATTAKFSLQQATTTLTEVVTTATGSERRIDISNDVVKIDADKLIQAAPVRSVTDLLVAAQVPGMIITPSSGEPGAPSRIRLGGVGSISENNDPVIIIDGVWVKSAFSTPDIQRQLASGNSGKFLPSRLDAIDPSTIESIEIVRGPAAATLYGPDAANGVIKVTTKRGHAGPARWDARLFRDWKHPGGSRPPEYVAYGHTAGSTVAQQCTLNEVLYKVCTQDSVRAYNLNDPFLSNEGNGFTNGASLTVSGGASQLTYSLTGSMQDEQGTRRIPGADQVRLRQLNVPLSSRFTHPSGKRDRTLSTRIVMTPRTGLDIALNLDGSQTNSTENNVSLAVSTGAQFSRFDTLTTLLRPVNVSPSSSYSTTTRGLVSLMTNWNPNSAWSGNMTVGLDRGFTREKRNGVARNCVNGSCLNGGTENSSADNEYSVYTTRLQSAFQPSLGWAGRFLTIRPGIAIDMKREVREQGRFTLLTNNTSITYGSRSEGPTTALAGIGVNAYIRLFDRISFDPAIRRDFGSKTFRNNAKSYPRFGTSWLISDESFFPKSSLVSSLRLRGALGYAAVQPDLTSVQGRYIYGHTIVNGVSVPTVDFDAAGNAQLEPERSFEVESGFDADLLGDRVQLTVTHSNKKNTNTLIDRQLAPSAGVGGTRQENVARVVNRSTTVQVSGRVADYRELSVRVGANIAIFDNRVKTLGSGVSPFGETEQRYVAGYPVGGLWVRPILAINDANHNGLLEANEIIVGDTAVYAGTNIPRYTTGYNLEVGLFNQLTFNTFVNYTGKHVQNRSAHWTTLRGYWDPTSSLFDQALANIVSLTGGGSSDRQSISELRLQSASVTYTVPTRVVQRFRARSLQISLQGSNLGLWTNYRGRDPSVNATPVGERTTDDGVTIAEPRFFSLQFRVGY